MLKNQAAQALILNRVGHVLLVRHNYGRFNWELPGGRAEPTESIVETATREVHEETGLCVVAESSTGIYYEPAIDFLIFVFRCYPVNDGQVLQPQSDDEITGCGYFPPDQLPRPISDFTIRRIQDALNGASMPLPITIPPRQRLDQDNEAV